MKTIKQTALVLSLATLTGISTNAYAAKNKHYDNVSVDYAKVIGVKPVTKRIKVSVPVEQCYNKQVWNETPRRHSHGHGHKNEVIGALIGAAVGNQIGKNAKKGNGREIGTVAGAVIGGVIGNSHSRHHSHRKSSGYYTTVRHCDTHHEVSYEDQLVGYDVTYKYRGIVYNTRTKYHPGDSLKVKVSVTPYDYS